MSPPVTHHMIKFHHKNLRYLLLSTFLHLSFLFLFSSRTYLFVYPFVVSLTLLDTLCTARNWSRSLPSDVWLPLTHANTLKWDFLFILTVSYSPGTYSLIKIRWILQSLGYRLLYDLLLTATLTATIGEIRMMSYKHGNPVVSLDRRESESAIHMSHFQDYLQGCSVASLPDSVPT